MLTELEKVLSWEVKCLCSKSTTVLSEETVPKLWNSVSYFFILLGINNILYRNVCILYRNLQTLYMY